MRLPPIHVKNAFAEHGAIPSQWTTALFQERCGELLGRARARMFFYVARCYRYERPQAGRYREFTQFGCELLGPEPERAAMRSQEIAEGFLDSLGLRYAVDSAAKRGLSYYLDGQGFEMRCPELGAQQQVAGGGAYREGAGFGIGAERLMLAMSAQGLIQPHEPPSPFNPLRIRPPPCVRVALRWPGARADVDAIERRSPRRCLRRRGSRCG